MKRIVLFVFVLLFVSLSGCTYLGPPIKAGNSVTQAVEDFDKNTCCESTFKNNSGCYCSEITASPTTSSLTDPALSGPWLLKTAMKNNETLYVIFSGEPTITFNNDGTFTVFGGCNYYKGNYALTGQTTELRKTIKMGPITQTTAMNCPFINYTERNYLQILQATETYYIRNNIEYMNLKTADGEQLFYRSGNL
jgi:heat shock protein HslJ